MTYLNFLRIATFKQINALYTLKVCFRTNDDNSVQFFALFCVVYKYINVLNFCRQILLKILFFFLLMFVCWNSDSKNSFVTCQKWVISDFIS